MLIIINNVTVICNRFAIVSFSHSVPMTKRQKRTESNGRGKRQKSSGGFSPLDVSAGSVVFRMLCPSSRIGGVIGKGGSVISQIRQETGVKLKIEEAIPGCDERVITILSSDKETEEDTAEQGKEVINNDETESKGKDDEGKDQSEDNEDNKDSVPVEDSQCEKGNSAIQKAVSLVFEKIVEGIEDTAEGDEESNKESNSSLVFRLLVLSNQVGCLLGKGGSVIKKMSADSGAQIRILPRDKLPWCASTSDELVQVQCLH